MMERIKFLEIEINSFISIKEVKEEIEKELKRGYLKKRYVVTPNVSHIIQLYKDKEFRNAYEKAWLILPDSVPIIWVSRLIGAPLQCRVAGADLINYIFDVANKNNSKIFLLGGTNGSEKIAEEKIRSLYPNVEVTSLSPSFGFEKREKDTKFIIDKINCFRPDFLFICVGTPKSEKWIYRNFDKIDFKMAFSLGAALDFFAGTKKRAPIWMQKMGLEWLFRLIQEPRRLWKRYLIGNIVFIWLIIRELIKKRILKKK